MINSNNLQTHLAWLRQSAPHVPDPGFVALAEKTYPKDKTAAIRPDQPTRSIQQPQNQQPTRPVMSSHESDDFDDDIIDLTQEKPSPVANTKRQRPWDDVEPARKHQQGEKERERDERNGRIERERVEKEREREKGSGGAEPGKKEAARGILDRLFATPRSSTGTTWRPQGSATSTPLLRINENRDSSVRETVKERDIRESFRNRESVENSSRESVRDNRNNGETPGVDTLSLLRSLVDLQDSKLSLYEEKFSVSESTSLSLDAKQDFYKNQFDPKLAKLSSEIGLLKTKIATAQHISPVQTSTQNGPSEPRSTILDDYNTFGFSSDDDDDILAAAAKSSESLREPVEIPEPPAVFKVPETPVRKSPKHHSPISIDEEIEPDSPVRNHDIHRTPPRKHELNRPHQDLNTADLTLEEDNFGNRTFEGLRTPTQERDEVDDLGSFIDDQEMSDGAQSYRDNSDNDSEVETVGEDETPHGLILDQEPTSDIELIEDGESTQKDSLRKQVIISDIEDDREDDLDDIEEIEDFTTQLNEERELTNGEIIELISDGEEESTFFPPPAMKLEPVIEVLEKSKNVDDGDSDFSDEDDPELMEILNNNQKILSLGDKENIPPGSEHFIKEVYQVLNAVFKLKSFRQNQLNAVCSSLQSKDVFVLMPTGGGKSLCYQLPALIQGGKTKGTTVVISPLISLMQDQVQHLLKLNVKAGMISSKATTDDNKQTLNLFRDGFLQIVYLSPEKANKSAMIQRIIGKLYENNQLARVVIDEAHCLSSWGHDFRPDYQGMGFFKEQYPKVPLMALTATANEKVRMDIVHHLKMSSPVLLKQSFNRGNLFYEIKWKAANYVEWIKDFVLSKHNGKTGIIYCHSKQSCEQTSEKLNSYGLKTSFYHAGMSAQDRFSVQTMWQQGKLQLICATIAFGMGIDKPNVRFVIHLFIPRSLEGYYQETGRAGRDGKHSECIMFYSYKDARSLQNMIQRDEELTREGKENHLAKLRQVVQYCENTTDCRRKQVLQYFNESFNPVECRKQCDNCLNSSSNTTIEKNCTSYAKDIISLVQSIQDDQVTVLHCQDVFKGSNSNKITKMGHNNSPYHGKGKSLDKTDVERIFFYLLSESCLLEYQIMKGGFASNYVRVGKYADQVLRGQKEIRISFSSSKSVRPTSSGNVVASSTSYNSVALRASNFGEVNMTNFSSFVTARQLSNGDFNANQASSIISLPQNQFGSEIENHASRQHIESSYRELCKVRIETSSELGISLQQIVGDSTITDMAIKLPTNKRDFASLSGISKEQLGYFSYFKKLLGTLSRERKKSSGGSANTSVGSVSSTPQVSKQKTNNVSPYFNHSQQDRAILDTLRGSMSQRDNVLPVASIKPGTKGYRSAGKKFYKKSHKKAPGNTQKASRPSGVAKPRAMPL